MGHEFPLGIFRPENRTTFSDVPLLPEICCWNDPMTSESFTFQPDFPETFVNGKQPIFAMNRYSEALERKRNRRFRMFLKRQRQPQNVDQFRNFNTTISKRSVALNPVRVIQISISEFLRYVSR